MRPVKTILFTLFTLTAVLAQAADMIGTPTTYKVGKGETVLDIARRFNLGYVETVAANPGIDPWLPPPGEQLELPTQHIVPAPLEGGIVVNLGDFRLYLFSAAGDVMSSWPIGIAREGFATPLGKTEVVKLRRHPAWIPPESARLDDPSLPFIVPPGPNNPLGDHALNLGFQGIIIHGTNNPWGIGRRVSRGCIRMYPEHIAELYQLVEVGKPVLIVNQPVKFAWHENQLYVEIHPSWQQADQYSAYKRVKQEIPLDLGALVRAAAGEAQERIDWLALREAAHKRRGTPVRIVHRESSF